MSTREAFEALLEPDVVITAPGHHSHAYSAWLVERIVEAAIQHEREECRIACRVAVLGLTDDQRQSGDMLDHAIWTAIRNREGK